ncbi:MAG: PAS domain-containing protein [Candidatus Cloacimonetes bacterium]|nr:PAS domain-containing protein [Candidatus Cloacimonadota bacterium]
MSATNLKNNELYFTPTSETQLKKEDSIQGLNKKIELLLNKFHILYDLKNNSLEKALDEFSVYCENLELQNRKLENANYELENNQKHYSELFEFASIGYVTYKDDMTILSMNETLDKMLGIGEEDKAKVIFTDFIHPDDKKNFVLHLESLKKTGKTSSCLIKITGVPKDYTVRVESNAFKDKGQLVFRSAIADLSQEYELAEKLDETNQKLALQNSTLSEYKRRLEATMLAGNIAWWQMNIKTG